MGQVIIKDVTPKNVLTLIGEMVGPCYGSDTSDREKNYKRGKRCILDGHGRVQEYANAWFILDGYSARVIREFYTAIGGAPTRTQASTRYIDYKDFDYFVPPAIENNQDALKEYNKTMDYISTSLQNLENLGIKREDSGNLLPLGMTTVVSVHMNARTLATMSEQRLCARAYHEYRQLMKDIIEALSNYSDEWKELCVMTMKAKCEKVGWCLEHQCCGHMPKKEDTVLITKEEYEKLKYS